VNNTRKVVLSLTLLSLGMFGFSFALVPLYNVFCKVTGLNGKVDARQPSVYPRYKVENEEGTSSRVITLEFDVNRNKDVRCEIIPQHTVMQIRPGELNSTSYYVKNLTDRKIIIQAIPSISPGLAARYLKKLECFCFNPQTLQPFEAMDLPLRFWVEPEIPESLRRFTLSYTLFDVTILKANES
jgi:cytochrome c oxidase assembly protein subunit 11